jgi:hypothetical protein
MRLRSRLGLRKSLRFHKFARSCFADRDSWTVQPPVWGGIDLPSRPRIEVNSLMVEIYMWNWLRTNKDPISSIAAIVGPFLTFAALIFTVVLSNRQLSLNRSTFQSNLIYTMQKDEQTIAQAFLSGITDDASAIFAQMQAVLLQRHLRNIPDDVWPAFQQDVCHVMSSERLRRDWETRDKKEFLEEFVSYMDSVTRKDSQICGGKQ